MEESVFLDQAYEKNLRSFCRNLASDIYVYNVPLSHKGIRRTWKYGNNIKITTRGYGVKKEFVINTEDNKQIIRGMFLTCSVNDFAKELYSIL